MEIAEGEIIATSPILSVIIPARNRPQFLQKCVDSVLAQTFADLEIIVVDDGSDPPLALTSPKTFILRQDIHVHACKARNLAVARACGRYLLCLDDDTELTDSTAIEIAVKFADGHPEVGVIGFCQLSPDGRPGLNPATSADPCLVGHFSGCGALLRRDVFTRIGGFTEMLGYYYEELEYCMRVFDADSLVAYHPGVRLVHYHDPTGRDWRRIHRFISRNALLTILLRFPWWAVAPATGAQIFNYIRGQIASHRIDIWGPFVVLGGVLTRLPLVFRQRRTVRWSSLRAYKAAQRHPRAV